jgi:poly-gamma-glutamate capsule biosynthesis protein CapA/YwtB (metallophosphatase superfamily)
MIIFTGDLYLANAEIKIKKKVLSSLNNSNCTVSNFEATKKTLNTTSRDDKSSILDFKEENLNNYLRQIAAINVFSLGNNHIHDFGKKGLTVTKEILNGSKNVVSFGADYYQNVIEPQIIEDNGKKIALLSVSTDEPEVMSKIATNNFQGVLDYNDDRIYEIIKSTKKSVDYFIILPHWGKEFLHYPSVQLRKKAYKWIEAGADLIIGHHPHVIQGKENYQGKWIYYSLGNYIFPTFYKKNGIKVNWKDENNKSILLEIDFCNEIKISEVGLKYNQKNNLLETHSESKEDFYSFSKILDLKSNPIKEYYKFWEIHYLEKIAQLKKNEKSYSARWFPQHKDYSRFGYFIFRIKKKYLSLK